MRPAPLLLTCLVGVLLLACSGGDDEPDPAATPGGPRPAATPTQEIQVEPSATLVPLPTAEPPTPTRVPITQADHIPGTFLEPRETTPDRYVSLPEPVQPTPIPGAPSLETWDRQSVVLYDLELGITTSFGPGFFVSFNSDSTKFGYNAGGRLHVVDLATGATEAYSMQSGAGGLIGDHHAISPVGNGFVLDLATGEKTAVDDIADPELRYLVEQRLRPTQGGLIGEGLMLRQADWNAPDCNGAFERCQAEAFEQWRVEELETGRVVLSFRAIAAAPAGPGELVIATSPQCLDDSGGLVWCEDVLEKLRITLDRASPDPQYVKGFTNLFLVDVASGATEFVATARYSPHPFIWPANWPLVASENFVAWTETYCDQPPGNTRMLTRETGELIEFDSSVWVRWHGEFLGIGEFSSGALLDPATLDYQAVAPLELSGAVWSSDLRYVAVGGILGHGGLC